MKKYILILIISLLLVSCNNSFDEDIDWMVLEWDVEVVDNIFDDNSSDYANLKEKTILEYYQLLWKELSNSELYNELSVFQEIYNKIELTYNDENIKNLITILFYQNQSFLEEYLNLDTYDQKDEFISKIININALNEGIWWKIHFNNIGDNLEGKNFELTKLELFKYDENSLARINYSEELYSEELEKDFQNSWSEDFEDFKDSRSMIEYYVWARIWGLFKKDFEELEKLEKDSLDYINQEKLIKSKLDGLYNKIWVPSIIRNYWKEDYMIDINMNLNFLLDFKY